MFSVKRGVSPEDASYFVGRSYLSMVQDAERDCGNPNRFDDLVEEQTPGGLNEQVSHSGLFIIIDSASRLLTQIRRWLVSVSQALGNLEKQNVFDSFDRAMDAVLSRLQGKSDGSLPSDG